MPSSTKPHLSVDVELYRRQERFTGTSLADCLDYDRLYHITKQWPAREHVELLERLADDLAEYCLLDARVEACRVIIRKLEVYPDSATPEITIYRIAPRRPHLCGLVPHSGQPRMDRRLRPWQTALCAHHGGQSFSQLRR